MRKAKLSQPIQTERLLLKSRHLLSLGGHSTQKSRHLLSLGGHSTQKIRRSQSASASLEPVSVNPTSDLAEAKPIQTEPPFKPTHANQKGSNLLQVRALKFRASILLLRAKLALAKLVLTSTNLASLFVSACRIRIIPLTADRISQHFNCL